MEDIEVIAAVLFALAVVHTFATKFFERLAHAHPRHAGLFHLLGEVEVVFGFWAVVLVVAMAMVAGGSKAVDYAETRQYTEPLFVFVIMVVAASRPVLEAIKGLLAFIARFVPLRTVLVQTWLCLALVPLLGSLVTEPAAMTLAALLLAPLVFRPGIPEGLKYGALGVLFVNISVGGTLTSFAAPPVLIVAATWTGTAPSWRRTSAGRPPLRFSSTQPESLCCCASISLRKGRRWPRRPRPGCRRWSARSTLPSSPQ